MEGSCSLPAGRDREGVPRAPAAQQPAKPLNKTTTGKEKSPTPNREPGCSMEGGRAAALGEFHGTAGFPSSGGMNQQPSTVEPQQSRTVLRGKHTTRATPPLPARSLARVRCSCEPGGCSQDISLTHTPLWLLWPVHPAEKAGKSSVTVPPPSWPQTPLLYSAPPDQTPLGVHTCLYHPQQWDTGDEAAWGAWQKETLLPQVTPIPLLHSSGIILTGERSKPAEAEP